mmetsp:Transcript_15192/g.30300  ORF Transcript_15192/g.30300 Transcript_15192/m.30300 type:complete len:111 (-) Transcript_15192:1018-1350(-)
MHEYMTHENVGVCNCAAISLISFRCLHTDVYEHKYIHDQRILRAHHIRIIWNESSKERKIMVVNYFLLMGREAIRRSPHIPPSISKSGSRSNLTYPSSPQEGPHEFLTTQ